MENTAGVYGTFEPKCKIRFYTENIEPNLEYIAIPAEELINLLADQMKLIALESGGVDNWSWYGDAMCDYRASLPECYGEAFWDWVHMMKSPDETAEEYVDDMSIEDFARYEVEVM
jgi:hypothetical protein